MVRETVGLVAYRAGEWAEAIGELRAARRMSGGPGQLAVLADCERALGHPERAIEISRSPEAAALDAEQSIELGIVSAGARADLGQTEAAVAQLEQLAATAGDSARVAFAYADLLEQVGRRDDAVRWFIRAADADVDEETDAAERLQLLGAEPTDGSSGAADDLDVDPDGDDAVDGDGGVDEDDPDGESEGDDRRPAGEPAATDGDDAPASTTSSVEADSGDGPLTVSFDDAPAASPTAESSTGTPTESDSDAEAHSAGAAADTELDSATEPTDDRDGRPPFVEAVPPPAPERSDEAASTGPADETGTAPSPGADPAVDTDGSESPVDRRSSDDADPAGEAVSPSFPGAPLFSDDPRTGA